MTEQIKSRPASSNLSVLQAQLPLVRKPGQYVGLEHNAVQAVQGALAEEKLNFCLIFPDLYEIGMSHQGLQILYHILNQRDNFCAHRAYTPDTDMEALLRKEGLPLFSLEAGVPLAAYDVLGITLPYELCYTNILTVLDLAGLPLCSRDRNDSHPLVLGGGPCAFNPEPVADFFDAILLGDGEEAIVDIANLLYAAKGKKTSRTDLLRQLSSVQGLYVPALFKSHYNEDNGSFQSMEALEPDYTSVRRAILPRLDTGELQQRPLVPAVKPVHDRLAMEIARGCTRGCRFCQAGILYRPVRERSPEDILDWADKGIEASGFEEMALLSLSTGDYSCLDELVLTLMNRFSRRRVALSMPSMRVGTLSPAIMEQIRRVRKTGFTIAPEAGSERLRQVINKGITEQDLLDTCRNAFSLGWNLIKFYFMTGLPTETEADVEAIATLVRKAKAQAQTGAGRGSRRGVQINVGVGTFVPKAHTPFQWEEQLSLEQSRERIQLLKQLLPLKGFKLKWHDPEQSYLEGVFARGDRRLSALIEQAWRQGARLDSWGEQFQLGRWQEAARHCGIDLDAYLRRRSLEEKLPWDHLDCAVERSFLLAERERALSRQFTPDCRTEGCQGCGICDFKTVQPVLHNSARPLQQHQLSVEPEQKRDKGISYRVHYSRSGNSRLLGHLELLQLIFRVLRRAGMPLAYTQGFNPTPKVAFSQALPVGMESMAEYFDMELRRPISLGDSLVADLNRELPPGLEVHSISFAPKKNAASSKADYSVHLGDHDQAAMHAQIQTFLACEHFPVTRLRKNRETTFNMRPLVAAMQLEEGVLRLSLIHHQGLPGVNPREVLEKIFGFSSKAALLCRVIKRESVDMPVPA